MTQASIVFSPLQAGNLLDYSETVKFYRWMLDQLGRYPRGGYHRKYGFSRNESSMQSKDVAS
jgi:hypothetical protein